MNKSLLTNAVAFLLCLIGLFSPIHAEIIFTTGVFSLSGGLTNWLAIHMLFEKVPFLYGSGVVLNRFSDFKIAIKNLLINEFFNPINLKKFFKESNSIPSSSSISEVNFDKIFDGLLDVISASKLSGMLAMIGGNEVLEPLRKPMILRLKAEVDIFYKKNFSSNDEEFVDLIVKKINSIIDERLAELTPKDIKKIVKEIMRKHLGWLVLWGGVFGGLIGFLVSIIKFNF